MELIQRPLEHRPSTLAAIELAVDRLTLAKRRWHGQAADGSEFAFDLERPLRHGDTFFQTSTHIYAIAQKSEPVLRLEPSSTTDAARAAWQIGNLHFQLMIGDDCLLVEDDPALRQMFGREQIQYTATLAVFQPLAGIAQHQHHDRGHHH